MSRQTVGGPATRWSPFTSFCEGPEDVETGFRLFPAFYRRNYAPLLPEDRNAKILVLSSGPGYFQAFLDGLGYRDVQGIDTDPAWVDEARRRGLRSECASCFDWLPRAGAYDFIFGEQEVNHLTRSEFLELLKRCRESLTPGGRLVLVAANCTNPLVATEHPGNNWDHYLVTAEGNLIQALGRSGFDPVEARPLDFYVLWTNPLNYVAKAITGTIHVGLKILFRLYGKNAKIFTKRLAVVGTRPD